MDGLEDSAAELGLDLGQRERFKAVPFSSLDTIGDRYKHMKKLLAEDQQFSEMQSRDLQNDVNNMTNDRRLQAMEQESAALYDLQKLDPLDDDFNSKVENFSRIAAYNPAVRNSLDQKIKNHEHLSETLGELAVGAAELGLSDEEFVADQNAAKEFLRRGEVDQVQEMLFRRESNLIALKKEQRIQQLTEDTELRGELGRSERLKDIEFEKELNVGKAEAQYAQVLEEAEQTHAANILEIDLPVGPLNQNAGYFNDELAGDRGRLPGVVRDHIADTILNSAIPKGTGSSELLFEGFEALESVATPFTKQSSDMTIEDWFVGPNANPDAAKFLDDMTKSALNRTKEGFVSEYMGRQNETVAEGKQPVTPEDRARLKDFLGSIYQEVTSIHNFSKEKERHRGSHKEFGESARKLQKQRLENQKKKSLSEREFFTTKILDGFINSKRTGGGG